MNASTPAPMALPDGVVALVAMRNVVLFPHVVMPITVGRAKSLAALRHAMAAASPLGIVLQKDAAVVEPGLDALCTVGTLATVLGQLGTADDQVHAVCHGRVDGIKDKVLAAQRAGLQLVLLPARNRKDLRDVPEATRAVLQFVWLETVDDAIHATFGTGRAVQVRPQFDLV